MTAQTVVRDVPPLFDLMDQAFGVSRKRGILYSWGDLVYNPDGVAIPPEILAHEAAHGRRQGTTEAEVRDWWLRYIDDPMFRLTEEVRAHQAEYRWLTERGNRQQRRSALKHVAKRLADPLYGGLVTPADAALLLAEA